MRVFADMALEVETLRWMMYRVADKAVQIHGGVGYNTAQLKKEYRL